MSANTFQVYHCLLLSQTYRSNIAFSHCSNTFQLNLADSLVDDTINNVVAQDGNRRR